MIRANAMLFGGTMRLISLDSRGKRYLKSFRGLGNQYLARLFGNMKSWPEEK